MENLLAMEFSIPLFQIMVLLVIMTIAVLFGYLKIGLFCTYGFLFYWGNILHIRAVFENTDSTLATASFLYMGFGLIIIFLAMVGFLLHKR
ncbi:MAG: hypothetical protein R6W75_07555 [Smithellaceae bacterium]